MTDVTTATYGMKVDYVCCRDEKIGLPKLGRVFVRLSIHLVNRTGSDATDKYAPGFSEIPETVSVTLRTLAVSLLLDILQTYPKRGYSTLHP